MGLAFTDSWDQGKSEYIGDGIEAERIKSSFDTDARILFSQER